MAIFIKLKPDYLSFDLDNAIKEGVRNNIISTLMVGEDGNITYKLDQGESVVELRFVDRYDDIVKYDVVSKKDKTVSLYDYAMSSGRFIEMIIRYFCKQIKDIHLESYGK